MKLLMSIVYVAVIGILAHYVGESLPRGLFSEYKFPYRAFKWERDGKFYNRLNIKKWKNHLPDMSRIMRDMLPKRITFDATSDNIDALIKETCVAECVHWGLIAASLGIFLFWRSGWAVLFWLVYNFSGNLPFIIIQRYNRPRLVMLEQRRQRRMAKA